MNSWLKKFLSRWGRHVPCLIGITAAAAAIYCQTLDFAFLTNWDDPEYITRNPVILAFSLENIIRAFTWSWEGNYAPLQILSYMLDHAIWGMDPGGFHLTNLLLHVFNGMLLYLLAIQISGSRTAGFIAALLFVVHPAQVESVAWLSQRKTLLAGFFFLSSFLLYLRSIRQSSRQLPWLGLSLLAFIAAILSKSSAVVLPLCLAAYEICRSRQGEADRLWWKKLLPFAVAAGVMAVLTIFLQSPDLGGGRSGYHGGSLWATLCTMIPVLVRYLVILIYPAGLSAVYLPPVKTAPDMEVLGALLVLAAVAAVGMILYRRGRPLFFWLCLFFLPLIPVSQLVPLVTLMNDRYLYLPLMGAAGLAGHAGVVLLNRMPRKKGPVFLMVVACAIMLFTAVSVDRTAVWRNSVSLWRDTVERNPQSKDILATLAESYKDAGKPSDALATYRLAFAMEGDFADARQKSAALVNAAGLLMDIGSFSEAETLLMHLVSRFPGHPSGFTSLASCYRLTGKDDAAEALYHQGLQLQPDNPLALLGLATLSLDRKQPEKAELFLARLKSAGVMGPDVLVALGRLAMQKGEYQQALQHLRQAVGAEGLLNPARLRLVADFLPLAADPVFRELTRAP